MSGQPTNSAMGGWGNQGGMWTPFANWNMGQMWTQPGNPYNQAAAPSNFINPSIASPNLNQQFQQNPNQFLSSYSPAAFNQFPFFYGNNGMWSSGGGSGVNLGGGFLGSGSGQQQQVVTQAPPQQSRPPLSDAYLSSGYIPNPYMFQGSLYNGPTGSNMWQPRYVPIGYGMGSPSIYGSYGNFGSFF